VEQLEANVDGPDNANGERGVEHQAVDTVILTYNRATDHLEVGGKANSLDLMLDMLGRATRAVEKQKRMEDALELQAKMAQQARDQAIAEELRKRR
jgi:hypothetical protein